MYYKYKYLKYRNKLNAGSSNFLDTTHLDSFRSFWIENKEEYSQCMELLKYVISKFEKYQITYFLFYGTLLGQVRHGGFIPWDDDIDLVVDSNKFLEVLDAGKLSNSTFDIVSILHKSMGFYYKFIYRDHQKIHKNNKKLRWSWPFIDIFLYQERQGKIYNLPMAPTRYSDSVLDKSLIFPIKSAIFQGLRVKIPNQSKKILEMRYGKDWAQLCKSGSYNHKKEQKKQNYDMNCSQVFKYYKYTKPNKTL